VIAAVLAMATKQEHRLAMATTAADLSALKAHTREQLSASATKEELSTLATKAELSTLATKAELSTLATKAELSTMVSKNDLWTMHSQLLSHIRPEDDTAAAPTA
jgi:hypothetical protein